MTSTQDKRYSIYLTGLILSGFLLASTFTAPSAWAGLDYVFFTVNGDTTATTMTQGDELSWGSNCDIGATINWEIWYDANSNSTIDRATDALLNSENITDGNALTEPNPILDGWSIGPTFILSGEPGLYIFRAMDIATEVSVQKSITMSAMSSPPNQLTGQISLPGISAPNSLLAAKVVYAESEGGDEGVYLAITDNMGMYSINVGDNGTGVELFLMSSSVSGFVVPDAISAIASGVVANNDFTYTIAADSVWGFVKDESGTVMNHETTVAAQSELSWRDVTTSGGRYAIYFSAADNGDWAIESDSRNSPSFLSPDRFYFNLDTAASFQHDIILTRADAMIYAIVTEQGGLPVNNYRLDAYSFALDAWSEAVSGTGTNNVAALGVSSLDNSGWMVSIMQYDDDFPIPGGLIIQSGTAIDVSPGDTVSFNLVNGHLVNGTISQDPEDGPIFWDDVFVIVGPWSARAGAGGDYAVYTDVGTHSISVWTDGALDYITSPSWGVVVVPDGGTTGPGFTINEAHCFVSGTLQNVSLPLDGSYYQVTARTGTSGFDGYLVTAQVDSATGTYSMNLSDGDWTIIPPCCLFDRIAPDSAVISIGERPDSERTVDFAYSSLSCCTGIRGNANSDAGDKINIGDVTYLIDYLFGIPTGPEPLCRDEGNANSDTEGKMNIADITYLMSYLFGIPLGPAPAICP